MVASLRYEQFRWLYISNTAFMFAMMGQFLVRSFLAFKLTDSAFSLGIVNFVVALPMLLVAPIGGVMADRFDRRKLIIGVQAAVVVDELIVLLLLITDVLTFGHLLILTGFLGALFPFMMPARQAIVVKRRREAGPRQRHGPADGGHECRPGGGPGRGRLPDLPHGVESTYSISLVLYAVGLGAMLKVHPSFPDEEGEHRSVFGDIADGLRYVRDNPRRPCSTPARARADPARDAFPDPPRRVCGGRLGMWVPSASGRSRWLPVLGGMVGSVYVAWDAESHQRLRRMMASIIAFGCTLMLFSISPWFLLALPFVFLADVFVSIFMVLNNTASSY